jgi:CRP-like cAMP-binding protein
MVSKCWLFDRRNYQKGKEIFSQGEIGETAYIVESGSVDIVKDIDGQRIYLATLGRGALFGEMAVIDGGARMASAIAAEHCVLMQLPRSVFMEKVEQADPFLRALLGILMGNLRNVHKTYNEQPDDIRAMLNSFSKQSENMRNYIASVEQGNFSEDLSESMEQVLNAIDKFQKCAEKNMYADEEGESEEQTEEPEGND